MTNGNVRRITDKTEVARLLMVKDDVHIKLNCERGPFVQWIMSRIDDDKLALFCYYEDDEILGYLLTQYANAPPVFHSVNTLFFGITDCENSETVLCSLIGSALQWAIEQGSPRLKINLDSDEYNKVVNHFSLSEVNYSVSIVGN